jgi:hypothetical protein
MTAVRWILVSLAVLSAALLLLRAIVAGYPPARLARGALLSRKEQAIVSACADALFPPGGPIPLSGTDAGLLAYVDTYVRRLPPLARVLVRLLFHSVEHGPWIFGPRPARFTRLRPEERVAVLRAMARSRMYFRRLSCLSLRAMMTMGYLAHPEVARTMRMVADPTPFDTARALAARRSFA